jgi:hypothetical protein
MRRFVPWALLGLLTVGAAAGVALGLANQPSQTPEQFVADALSATARAGTLHFEIREVVTSSNRELRSSSTTSGVVDLTRGDPREDVVMRTTFPVLLPGGLGSPAPPIETVRSLTIGRSLYLGVTYGGMVHWTKETLDRAAAPLLDLPVFTTGISELTAASVQDLGPDLLWGRPTTKYAVTVAPPACLGTKSPIADALFQNPGTVWIDSAGRIVQERSVFRESFAPSPSHGHQSGSGSTTTRSGGVVSVLPIESPVGTSTTVTTVRFTDFGAPVSIEAPTVRVQQFGNVGVSKGEAKSTPCPGVALLIGG